MEYRLLFLIMVFPCQGSVGRVKWRPQRRDYLSSSSLVVDSAIHVWDIKRPFVPFASFDNHKVSSFIFCFVNHKVSSFNFCFDNR